MPSRGEPSSYAKAAARILTAAANGPLKHRFLRSNQFPDIHWSTFGTVLRRLVKHGSLAEQTIDGVKWYATTGKPAPDFKRAADSLAAKNEAQHAKRLANRQQVADVYAGGTTAIKQIARATGLCRESVRNHLRALGLKGEPIEPPIVDIPDMPSDSDLARWIAEGRRRKAERAAARQRQARPKPDPVARYVAEWRRMRRASRANAA